MHYLLAQSYRPRLCVTEEHFSPAERGELRNMAAGRGAGVAGRWLAERGTGVMRVSRPSRSPDVNSGSFRGTFWNNARDRFAASVVLAAGGWLSRVSAL